LSHCARAAAPRALLRGFASATAFIGPIPAPHCSLTASCPSLKAVSASSRPAVAHAHAAPSVFPRRFHSISVLKHAPNDTTPRSHFASLATVTVTSPAFEPTIELPIVSLTPNQSTYSSETLIEPIAAASHDSATANDNDGALTVETTTEEDIRAVLLDKVAPAIRDDGGDIELVSWDAAAGEVCVRLLGACRSCDRSTVTMRMLVERALKFYLPAVRHVRREERTEPYEREFNG